MSLLLILTRLQKVRPYYQYLQKKYGPVSGFYLGKQPRIIITDVEIVKGVMVKDFNNFMDHPVSNHL